jgi:hypothetical protein
LHQVIIDKIAIIPVPMTGRSAEILPEISRAIVARQMILNASDYPRIT